MANAPAALAAALRPIAAVAVPSSVSAGQNVTLEGGGSAAANGHSISTYQWTSKSGVALTIGNAGSANATVTLPSCGIATVGLTVTDDAGRQDSADVVISPNSITTAAPASASGQAACSLTIPAVEVAVCPATATVTVGTAENFSASLANTSNTAVTWEVNGISGGNATVGT